MATWETMTTLVSRVGKELGLGSLTANLSTTDETLLQLQELLTATGRKLVKEYPWLQQRVDYTFTTTNGVATYAMPTGFVSLVDGSAWNRTTQRPVRFVSAQKWETLKATSFTAVDVVIARFYRAITTVGLPTLELYETPGATTHTYALQYRSRLWVRPSGTTAFANFLDAPAAVGDTVAIEAELFVPALKLAWKREKGLPSEAAQQDFEAALEVEKRANVVEAPRLSFSPRENGLSTPWVPEGSWS